MLSKAEPELAAVIPQALLPRCRYSRSAVTHCVANWLTRHLDARRRKTRAWLGVRSPAFRGPVDSLAEDVTDVPMESP